MRKLEGYETVLIIDDSGSMGTIDNTPSSGNPYAKGISRWDELKNTTKMIINIGTCLDPSGVDIYFLNREGKSNVTDFSQVEHLFAPEPAGRTPLFAALQQVIMAKKDCEKPVLLIIATDGEPTGPDGTSSPAFVTQFITGIKTRPKNFSVSIVACTNDKSSLGYLDELDKSHPGIDVADDYPSERDQILRVGKVRRFTMGDYVAKIFLGPNDAEIDALDEAPPACCVIM